MNFSLLRCLPVYPRVLMGSLLCTALLAHAGQQAPVAVAAPAAVPATVPGATYNLQADVPVGPQVKVGKLANGLTYYIQKNNKPEKKIELRLVVKAGSILEDDDQQGLAHFTEHMAFNGSTHFKRNELVSYLQSIGVKFGADLNAYTSFDETVYMLPIPTDNPANIDKGFLVLQDWAHGLLFNRADIDSERPIILEELRLGKGADDRMSKVLMPKLLNGSRYAERLPIGKEDIIKTFQPDVIKRFYHDWYRPDLMAVMVVGDIDPAHAEQLVQRYFGGLQNPPNERPRTYAEVPTRAATEGLVVTDKEAGASTLFIRYQIQKMEEQSTFGAYRKALIESLYGQMLSERMQELTQQANPPFIQGGSQTGKVVRGYKSYNAYAVVGKGGVQPAIDALIEEDERARKFGFTDIELDRAKKNLMRGYERAYNERDKSDSAGYVAEYIRNFLEQEPIPGIANEYAYVRQMVPRITLDDVNQAVRAALPADQKKLVVFMGSDHGDSPVPGSAQLLAAVAAAEQRPVLKGTDKLLATQLMERPPVAGSIVAEKTDKALGLTELTLSNGVKVVLKPTDFMNDQVLMSSTRFGGQSLVGDSDIVNARYTSAIIGQMGLETFSPLDLSKILAGKAVNVGAYMGSLSEGVAASSGSADLETMLQLVYLRYTAPRKDEAIYSSFIGKQRDLARTALARPESVFRDTLQGTLYADNPRVARVPRPEDFSKIDLDRVLTIYRDHFASARDSTFFIVGSFDVASIKPLIATYLASLPTGPGPTMFKDLGVRPVTGVVKKAVYSGSEPKSDVSLTFTGSATFSESEQLRLQALVDVLNIKLIEVLREQMGLIYGGGVSASLEKYPYQHYTVGAMLPTGPDNVDKVIAATLAEIGKLKEHGPSPEDLAKVKVNWLKNHEKSLRENSYWLSRLQSAAIAGTDPATILTFDKQVAAVTPADVQAAARRYFDMNNYVQVVLYPEPKTSAAAAPAAAH